MRAPVRAPLASGPSPSYLRTVSWRTRRLPVCDDIRRTVSWYAETIRGHCCVGSIEGMIGPGHHHADGRASLPSTKWRQWTFRSVEGIQYYPHPIMSAESSRFEVGLSKISLSFELYWPKPPGLKTCILPCCLKILPLRNQPTLLLVVVLGCRERHQRLGTDARVKGLAALAVMPCVLE